MSDYYLPGHPPIPVTLRRTAGTRRFSLRVSRLDGRVTLALPQRASVSDALAFASEKADWVRRMCESAPLRVIVAPGASLPFQGRDLVVTVAAVRSPRVDGDALLVPDDPDRAGVRAAAYYKMAARQSLQASCEGYAAALGRPFQSLTLRDTRSRWGSCSAKGALMFSWRLIMAPPDVLAYVAAHEVAHLAEMNHSAAFWSRVADLMPDYSARRNWLKRHGSALHRFDFGG